MIPAPAGLIYTLVPDGPSDRSLLPVINWLLTSEQVHHVPQLADLRALPNPPASLGDRIATALVRFPCDLLFVHRDAEREPADRRIGEIRRAVGDRLAPRWIPIVPVRMTETWLLIDESAIRTAADNREGRTPLDLPTPRRLESVAEPKTRLRTALLQAADTAGRRRKRFERDIGRRVLRVAELIEDFSPLRQLSAFQAFERATRSALEELLG